MLNRTILGSYVTTRLLGQGGMGAVYVAEHATLGTKLAAKVLLPEAAQHAHVVQRFIAEAKAASAIDNPHIIKVFDAGQLETGQHFIALEFLDGYPVTDMTGQRPLDEVLKVMAQVASGLEAAHGRGIIHRDLKPDNLFFRASLAGQDVETLFSVEGEAKKLVLAGDAICWLEPEQVACMRDDAVPFQVAAHVNTHDLRMHENGMLYWTTTYHLYRASLDELGVE